MSENTSGEHVIVAEDSAPNRKILAHLLKKMGYEVVPCEDGEQAWNALINSGPGTITAILSDVMMPKMDGLTLLKNVRESEKYKTVPFVLVTAVSDQKLVVEATDMGVNGYILKPVTYARVEQKMRELFPNKIFPKISA